MGNHNSKKIKYRVPPGSSKPNPPSKPSVECIGEDVIVRWNEPQGSGGCPIIGYVLQYNRVDGDFWESYRVSGTECVLQNLDDTFIFRVIAENIIGYSEPSENSVPVSFEFTEPTLLVPLNHQIRAIEFEKIELNCRIWGMPSPEITWYLNGEELSCDGRLFICTDGIDHRLIFNHIKISDEGEVRVNARNVLGEIENTTSLIVEAPPRIKSNTFYEEGIISSVGENLRLKFAYTGRPRPEVTWFHEGEVISANNIKTEEIGDVTILNVDGVTKRDGGEYTLRIENSIGEDVSHVLVTVIDRPRPPGKPLVILMSDNSCLLEWESGNEEIVGYCVEYFRDGWGVWLKALSTRKRGCKIRDLIPGSKYTFRVKAENHFGMSDSGEASVQIFIPESKKEHGSIMSSIQEDEFEVFSELKWDLSNERLEIPPIPGVKKPTTKADATKTSALHNIFRTTVDSAHQNKDFLSPTDIQKITDTLRDPRLRGNESSGSDNDNMREIPSPESNHKLWGRDSHGMKRSEMIGNTSAVSKSDDSLASASSNHSDSKHKLFDHYGQSMQTKKGADRFEKYRKDTRLEQITGKLFTLGSDKGPCNDLESGLKDNNFVIVEGGSMGEDQEDSMDFVVSQLVVPVKSGNFKISTSFDNGSLSASSVKSSFDDLSSVEAPLPQAVTRTTTPNELVYHYTDDIPEEAEPQYQPEPSPPAPPLHQPIQSKSTTSVTDREGSRKNLLHALHVEMKAMKTESAWKQPRDSLIRGGSSSRAANKSPSRLDGLLSRDENPYIGRYITGGHLSSSTIEKLYGTSNVERHNKKPQGKKSESSKESASAHSLHTKKHEKEDLLAKSNIETSESKCAERITTPEDTNTQGTTKSTGETENPVDVKEWRIPRINLPTHINVVIDHFFVAMTLCMLSPLLLLNAYTLTIFCLLLIKMTWM